MRYIDGIVIAIRIGVCKVDRQACYWLSDHTNSKSVINIVHITIRVQDIYKVYMGQPENMFKLYYLTNNTAVCTFN